MASDPVRGVDGMKLIQHLAGVMVETYFVFDEPDRAMQSSFYRLSQLLECEPLQGKLGPYVLPPGHVMDQETERGRHAAREIFEDWLDCAFEFHELMISIIHNVIVSWEREDGIARSESFRLLMECAQRCMAFEVAAQELCDVVIDKKVSTERWGLAECIAALSAVAGHRLALSLSADMCEVFKGVDLPDSLDKLVYVMTQEAIRLGVPAGSDWRFGLAANDIPLNAPFELVYGIEPYCKSFFVAINLHSQYDQAVACAKAAGRMLAVAAGGEVPEMEPAIAKPLAMAAITETYKSVCMEHRIVSY